mmetsp:Transcript_66390/g.184978  ORF Transcript_66390/g.184978 Transcript_66390/m.184978 type:complete len:312 (+) Transcript_66390:246-1181(+)
MTPSLIARMGSESLAPSGMTTPNVASAAFSIVMVYSKASASPGTCASWSSLPRALSRSLSACCTRDRSVAANTRITSAMSALTLLNASWCDSHSLYSLENLAASAFSMASRLARCPASAVAFASVSASTLAFSSRSRRAFSSASMALAFSSASKAAFSSLPRRSISPFSVAWAAFARLNVIFRTLLAAHASRMPLASPLAPFTCTIWSPTFTCISALFTFHSEMSPCPISWTSSDDLSTDAAMLTPKLIRPIFFNSIVNSLCASKGSGFEASGSVGALLFASAFTASFASTCASSAGGLQNFISMSSAFSL